MALAVGIGSQPARPRLLRAKSAQFRDAPKAIPVDHFAPSNLADAVQSLAGRSNRWSLPKTPSSHSRPERSHLGAFADRLTNAKKLRFASVCTEPPSSVCRLLTPFLTAASLKNRRAWWRQTDLAENGFEQSLDGALNVVPRWPIAAWSNCQNVQRRHTVRQAEHPPTTARCLDSVFECQEVRIKCGRLISTEDHADQRTHQRSQRSPIPLSALGAEWFADSGPDGSIHPSISRGHYISLKSREAAGCVIMRRCLPAAVTNGSSLTNALANFLRFSGRPKFRFPPVAGI
jgi:hypothetical protein